MKDRNRTLLLSPRVSKTFSTRIYSVTMTTRPKKVSLGSRPRQKIKEEINKVNEDVITSWFLENNLRKQLNGAEQLNMSDDFSFKEDDIQASSHALSGSIWCQLVHDNRDEVNKPPDDSDLLAEQWELIGIIQRHLIRMSAKRRRDSKELMEVLYNLMVSVKLIAP